jgi:hypothetical protein
VIPSLDPTGSGAGLQAAWERAAGEMIAGLVRDPRTLELGAAMLNGALQAARAQRLAWEAWTAPFFAGPRGGI